MQINIIDPSQDTDSDHATLSAKQSVVKNKRADYILNLVEIADITEYEVQILDRSTNELLTQGKLNEELISTDGIYVFRVKLIEGLFVLSIELVRELTPAPTPAPENEVLIMVTTFVEGESGAQRIDNLIYAELDDRVLKSELKDVSVKYLEDVAPSSRSEAIKLGERYNATIVIWGIIDSNVMRINYEVVQNKDIIREKADLGTTSADLPTFSTVIADTADEFDFLMLFSLGQIAYFSKKYQEAIDLFDQALAIEINPERKEKLNLAIAYMYRGYAYSYLENYDSALADVNKAIELDPKLARAYNFRGYVYYYQNESEKSIGEFKKAIELDPNYSTPYNNIGAHYGDQGDYETAITYYQQAVIVNTEDTLAYRNLGYAYYNLCNFEAALSAYEHAIEIKPEEAENYNALGDYYYNIRNYERSLEYYLQAIDLDSSTAYYYLDVGNAYEGLQQYDAAIKYYNQTRDMGDNGGIHSLARMYENGSGVVQNYSEALALYQQASELGNTTSLYGIANLYYNGWGVEQSYEKALEYYQKAADKGLAVAFHAIGTLYYNGYRVAKDYDKAVAYFEQAAKKGDTYAQKHLGVLYKEGENIAQDYKQAVHWLAKAACKGQVAAQFHYAQLLEQGNGIEQNYDEAVMWYRKAADQYDKSSGDSDNRLSMYSLGRLYEDGMGVESKMEEAVKWYRRAANQGLGIAMEKLVSIYEQGNGVPVDKNEAERWQANANSKKGAKRFTVPCVQCGENVQKAYHIYIIEIPFNPKNPLEEEEERLWKDFGVTIPAEVVEAFGKLYVIAQENKVSFLDLVVYALGAAQSGEAFNPLAATNTVTPTITLVPATPTKNSTPTRVPTDTPMPVPTQTPTATGVPTDTLTSTSTIIPATPTPTFTEEPPSVLITVTLTPTTPPPAPPLVASDSTIARIKERGYLIAGVKYDALPFGYRNETGQVVGFEVDLMREFAAHWLGDPGAVEFVQVSSSDRITKLLESEVDILAATMTHTKDRDQKIDFSQTYFLDGQNILVRRDSGIQSIEDLDGKKVGAVKGSTSARRIEEYALENKIQIQPVFDFGKYTEAVKPLLDGDIDALTTDRGILIGLTQQHPELMVLLEDNFSHEPYGIGVTQGDSYFANLVNFTLQQMKEDGTYDQLYQEWFCRDGSRCDPYPIEILPGNWPYTFENSPDTLDSTVESVLSRMINTGVFRAGVKYDAPPFGYRDANGQLVGFEIDLMREFAKRWLGDPNAVEFVQVSSSDRITKLVESDVDIVAATMTHTKARDDLIDFSQTYLLDGQNILVRVDSGIQSIQDLDGKIVAAVRGSTSIGRIQDYAAANNISIQIEEYDKYTEALRPLLAGDVHALTTDSGILLGLMRDNPELTILLEGNFSREPYGMGVPNYDHRFRDLVNFTLQALKEDGTYDILYQYWFGREKESFAIERWPGRNYLSKDLAPYS